MAGVGLVTSLYRESTAGCAALTFFLVLEALVLGLAGVESARWGSKLGKANGTSSRGWFEAGVSGCLAGSATLPTLGLFILLVARGKGPGRDVPAAGLYAMTVLLALMGAVLGSHWRWVARVFLSLMSGFAFCCTLAITLHMTSLLPKTIFLIIVLLLSLIFGVIVALPNLSPSLSSRFLCVWSAILGTYLLACAICLWQPLGFVDAISLFVAENGVFSSSAEPDPGQVVVDWTTVKVKGFVAGLWLLSVAFSAFQLWRYRQIGEDPDHIWDRYLGDYINADGGGEEADLDGRKGIFQARPPWYQRIFRRTQPQRRASLWPEDDEADEFDLDEKSPRDLEQGPFKFPQIPRYDSQPDSLAEHIHPSRRSVEELKRPTLTDLRRPTLPAYASHASGLSGATLVAGDGEVRVSKPAKYEELRAPKYSEPPAGSLRARMKALFGQDAEPAKVPRHSLSHGSQRSMRSVSPPSLPAPTIPEACPVQATPSLIKAIERISEAQQQAMAWRSKQTIDEVQEGDETLDEHGRIDEQAEKDFVERIKRGAL